MEKGYEPSDRFLKFQEDRQALELSETEAREAERTAHTVNLFLGILMAVTIGMNIFVFFSK